MLLISEIKLNIDDNEEDLIKIIKKKLHLHNNEIKSFKIHKKSLDARKDVVYKYQVLVELKNENKYLKNKNVVKYHKVDTSVKKINSDIRPLIVGYGPSGIFATFRLLEAGLKPIVFEKGKRIKERQKDVEDFFNKGILNPNSNVQFGEGGAGTFSDAKLTTRIKDPFIEYILDIFIKFGAKENIKYIPHAHIGTDEIRKIIERMTDYLISQGVEFHFEEEMEQLLLDKKHAIQGIKTNKGDYLRSIVVLGIGHSAYKTIKNIYDQGINISPKDMAIGFRVEHPQSLIDANQLKGLNTNEASEYFLRYNDEKAVYSFCMCPGGMVIPASSDLNRIVTNGMSYSLRNSGFANSAILVQINKEEYKPGDLGGFELLKEYEEKAFQISSSYKALSMNIKDYIEGTNSPLIFKPSYPLGTIVYDFNKFFNEKDNLYFKKALKDFDKKIPGFIKEGIMIGPETRSSSPIRINRDETYQSINTKGLYPTGEGAGYGGGIMSCSLDGIRIANAIITKIHNSV